MLTEQEFRILAMLLSRVTMSDAEVYAIQLVLEKVRKFVAPDKQDKVDKPKEKE